jgi:SAM-dependent methyltransferase
MDFKEYKQDDLSTDDEVNHWWIKTRFLYIDYAISMLDQPISVIEYGCGTGQNLRYLREYYSHPENIKSLTGVDINLPENYYPEWMTKDDKFINNNVNIEGDKYNMLIAMDVLEHIESDSDALREWVSNINDGSIVLITVPAMQHLFSYHDRYMGHHRRYTRRSLIELGESVELQTVKVMYVFSYLYPVVFFIRKILSKILKSEEKSDLKKTNSNVNSILYSLGIVENKLGACIPFGTSVVGIFQKKSK